MTNEEIMKLEAGPEMDLLIAEKIFGHRVISHRPPTIWIDNPDDKENGGFSSHCGCYSTNIESAWNVVEKLQTEPYEFFFGIEKTPSIPYAKTGKPHWHVEFGGKKTFADTAPLAICRAALLCATNSRFIV
jgi:hypothetical protein